MKEIYYFNYTNLYFKWYKKLDKGYQAVVRRAIKKLELGLNGQIKHIEKVLYELKIDIGKGIRIYYIQDGNKIIIILKKKNKKRQQKDIDKSKELMEIYFSLKGKGEEKQWLKK